MTTTTLILDGMHCASCALNIDDELESLPGVSQSITSYAHQTCQVTYDQGVISVSRLRETIKNLGYQVQPTS